MLIEWMNRWMNESWFEEFSCSSKSLFCLSPQNRSLWEGNILNSDVRGAKGFCDFSPKHPRGCRDWVCCLELLRKFQIPWNWSHKLMWATQCEYWELNGGLLWEQKVLLITYPSLWLLTFNIVLGNMSCYLNNLLSTKQQNIIHPGSIPLFVNIHFSPVSNGIFLISKTSAERP